MAKTIYIMHLDKMPSLNSQTSFCAGKFDYLGNKHNVLNFLKKQYGELLVESVSLLSASDHDDDPNLQYAFRVHLTNGLYWNGAVKAEQLNEW